MLKPIASNNSTLQKKASSLSDLAVVSTPNSTKHQTKPEPKELNRLRTPRVFNKSLSAPFKSPLLKPGSASASTTPAASSSGIEKRKIQTLEKQLHLLRQAKKIRLAGYVLLFSIIHRPAD